MFSLHCGVYFVFTYFKRNLLPKERRFLNNPINPDSMLFLQQKRLWTSFAFGDRGEYSLKFWSVWLTTGEVTWHHSQCYGVISSIPRMLTAFWNGSSSNILIDGMLSFVTKSLPGLKERFYKYYISENNKSNVIGAFAMVSTCIAKGNHFWRRFPYFLLAASYLFFSSVSSKDHPSAS